MSLLLQSGQPSFAVLAVANLLLGGIGGVYYVAYDSFYPLLISEGNYQKAYSISATFRSLLFYRYFEANTSPCSRNSLFIPEKVYYPMKVYMMQKA